MVNRYNNFQNFYNSTVNRSSAIQANFSKVVESDEKGWVTVRGIHIYSDIRFSLRMSESEDEVTTSEYLQAINYYVNIADSCAKIIGAKLLEVQGQRLHFFYETDDYDLEEQKKLFTFAASLTDNIYERFGSREKFFKSFAMSADFGESILLWSGSTAQDSIISLGPSANDPAKQLTKTPAGHLRIRKGFEANEDKVRNHWTDIKLVGKGSYAIKYRNSALTESFSAVFNQYESFIDVPKVIRQLSVSDKFYNEKKGTITDPTQVIGFTFRADLDGFTQKVKDAFDSDDESKVKLVDEFFEYISHGEKFSKKISNRVIHLPWSGDCANMIILPKFHEEFDEAKEYTPVDLSHNWLKRSPSCSSNLIASKWNISIGGGNSQEGNDGFILVAQIKAGNRAFLIASGWSVGITLKALETNGVIGNDTVMHNVDYHALKDCFKSLFSRHGSNFRKSNNLAEHDLHKQVIKKACATISPVVSINGRKAIMPVAKPHGGVMEW